MTSSFAQSETLHGTVVLLPRGMALAGGPAPADAGVLLRGPSGSGKSDLAFRLMAMGAFLVADDQVQVTAHGAGLALRAPESLRGLLEVRGVGLMRFAPRHDVPLSLVVDLVPRDEVPRLPAPRHLLMQGCNLPLFSLHAFDAAAPLKVLAAAASVAAPERVIR